MSSAGGGGSPGKRKKRGVNSTLLGGKNRSACPA
eukprot:CAMPEP_0204309580 /NCGR_PEP_ID=MMETSP0469-20131031/1184_1 /ASSEMBLY_ACC=CAM_ASM_000384 /TAXON_ID=2969 /ORGANISM="Oxyrrhis marina" /LENGTH=33 /DNA_ID= /DNA_START= /DNA_END= /DNA_ORIENTATION=